MEMHETKWKSMNNTQTQRNTTKNHEPTNQGNTRTTRKIRATQETQGTQNKEPTNQYTKQPNNR